MYGMKVDGSGRSGSFTIDTADEHVQCETLEIGGEDKENKSDFFKVMIIDPEKNSQLTDGWMTLVGKPYEICEAMRTKWPMAIIESEAIFAYLDTIDPDTEVIITYPLEPPSSKIVRDSGIHKAMRMSQKEVIAAMYETSKENVEVLDINT